jgi:ribonuclease HII
MTRPTRRQENKLFRQGYSLIAGADEAGRGAWAGPLVAAAVILPRRFSLKGINDSKKLTARQREKMYAVITRLAVDWKTTVISCQEIDLAGVGRANSKALAQSIKGLKIKPEAALVDSLKISTLSIPCNHITKGDAKVTCIAAASILAKVTRDRLMISLHKKYPRYSFHSHKGYGTAVHRKKILKYGLSPQHRRSFEPMKSGFPRVMPAD